MIPGLSSVPSILTSCHAPKNLRVGLANSSGAIGKDSGIVAVQNSITEEFSGLRKHIHLARIFIEGKIERILLFFGSILSKMVALV